VSEETPDERRRRELQEYVDRTVREAPPLTEAQKQVLARLLRPRVGNSD
jgi:hypothetical protein